MKRISLILMALVALWASPLLAQSFKVGDIEVDHPWLRATPGKADTTAGYFRVTNTGAASDRLVGATTSVASSVMIYETTTDRGVSKMRPLAGGLEIKPGQTVELKPGSFHAMFMGLKQPLKQGDRVKGTLSFEKAGALDVEYSVESVGARQPAASGKGHMH